MWLREVHLSPLPAWVSGESSNGVWPKQDGGFHRYSLPLSQCAWGEKNQELLAGHFIE